MPTNPNLRQGGLGTAAKTNEVSTTRSCLRVEYGSRSTDTVTATLVCARRGSASKPITTTTTTATTTTTTKIIDNTPNTVTKTKPTLSLPLAESTSLTTETMTREAVLYNISPEATVADILAYLAPVRGSTARLRMLRLASDGRVVSDNSTNSKTKTKTKTKKVHRGNGSDWVDSGGSNGDSGGGGGGAPVVILDFWNSEDAIRFVDRYDDREMGSLLMPGSCAARLVISRSDLAWSHAGYGKKLVVAKRVDGVVSVSKRGNNSNSRKTSATPTKPMLLLDGVECPVCLEPVADANGYVCLFRRYIYRHGATASGSKFVLSS